MPNFKDKQPENNSKVKFRIEGDKHLHEGTYKDGKFESCNTFICYDVTDGVDYWRPMK